MVDDTGSIAPPVKRPRGRPRTQTDEERRSAILTEARHTFMEQGYRGTTTDIVAARCKVSKQTIYKLFDNKADLFLAIVGDHRRMMLALPRPAGEDAPPDEVLEQIFMIDIDEEAEREREAFIAFIIHESAQVPELADILNREGIGRSRISLAEWLDGQVARGKLSVEDTLSGARMLMDLLFGAMGPGGRDWPTRQHRRAYMRSCIELFVRGSAPKA